MCDPDPSHHFLFTSYPHRPSSFQCGDLAGVSQGPGLSLRSLLSSYFVLEAFLDHTNILFFETRSHCVTWAGLELEMEMRLVSNSENCLRESSGKRTKEILHLFYVVVL